MHMKYFLSILILSVTLSSCAQQSAKKVNSSLPSKKEKLSDDLSLAYFASGCFWCVEAVYESVEGVKEAVSGYAGGQTDNPTYKSIGTGTTGHAETVKVYYDPDVVSFQTLVDVFFASGDPTTLNQQGPDRGTQYRSILFYQTDEEKAIIENTIKKLEEEKAFKNPIVSEVTKHTKFYEAEAYHQDYEKLHPENPYVKGVSIPRLKRFQAKMPDILK